MQSPLMLWSCPYSRQSMQVGVKNEGQSYFVQILYNVY